MMVTGTSSPQTAGYGHTEIQQGLLVKQDCRLQRIAGTQNLLIPPLLARRKQLQSTDSVMTAELPVTERIASYRKLSVTEKSAVPTITGK